MLLFLNLRLEVVVSMKETENKKKVSMYTIFIPKVDESYVVANTLSGAVLHIDDKAYLEDLVNIMQSRDEVPYNENSDMHKHFYDSGIFVDDDTDEYSMTLYYHEQGVIRNNNLCLVLLPTRQCNLRCTYCYEDFRNEYMTDETYGGILKYLEKSLENKLHGAVTISLFGGEPFLQFDRVLSLLKRAKDICKKYDIPFSSNATTNFTLVSKERFIALADVNCTYFQVTLDGLAKTHDINRVCKDGSGSFDIIVKNLLDAKQCNHDFKINIRTNFDERVAENTEEFYRYIKENFNDSRFSVFPYNVRKMGGKNDKNLNVLSGSQATDVLVDASQIIHELGLKNSVSKSLVLPFSGICYASKHNNFIIDWDGTIMKCTVDLDADINKIGRLESDGSIIIDHKIHCKWINREGMIKPECKGCDVFPICFGKGCPLRVVKGDGESCDKERIRRKIIKDLINLAL